MLHVVSVHCEQSVKIRVLELTHELLNIRMSLGDRSNGVLEKRYIIDLRD